MCAGQPGLPSPSPPSTALDTLRAQPIISPLRGVMLQSGTKWIVLPIFVFSLFNCAGAYKPRLQAPAPFAGLALGMSLAEAEKALGEFHSLSPISTLNEFGQQIVLFDFARYKTERDRSEGSKTYYRLYFYSPSKDGPLQLVYWGEVEDNQINWALIKKTKFK